MPTKRNQASATMLVCAVEGSVARAATAKTRMRATIVPEVNHRLVDTR